MNEVTDCPVQDWGSEEWCFPPGNVVGEAEPKKMQWPAWQD